MIGTDYHMHTHYVGCANQTMQIPAILDRCRKFGRTSIAVTDHCDKDWQYDKAKLIREELVRTNPDGMEVYFGCEVNVQGLDGGLTLTTEKRKEYGFEIVVGGVHSTWFKDGEATVEQIVERQVDLQCKAAANLLIDVLVHPWWIPEREFRPQLLGRFTSMAQVPDELNCRLAEMCVKHGKPVELNTAAIYLYPLTDAAFKDSYSAYLARLVELGCSIALATDAHDINHLDSVMIGEKVLADIGLPASRVWRPELPPRVAGLAFWENGETHGNGTP